MAYHELEPWGPQRDNWHSARVAHILANVHRGKNKPSIPLSEFMWHDPVQDKSAKEAATVEWLRAKVKN